LEQDPQKWDRDVDNIMNVSDPWVDSHIDRIMATQLHLNEQKKGEDDARTAE
jgi:hypothetical protein